MHFLFVAERTSRLRTAGKRCIITAIFRERCMAEAKKKVYVETSVVSYLTAKPSHDLIKMLVSWLRKIGGKLRLMI